MLDYAVPCPACNFALRFHDASLFGRKARCPQCHLKFVLSKPAERSSGASPGPVNVGQAREPVVASAATPETFPAPTPAAAPAPSEDRWLSDGLSTGFRTVWSMRRRRWTLPDPLRVSHASVIGLGAAAGAAATLLWPSGPTALISCLAAVAGGLLATALLALQLR